MAADALKHGWRRNIRAREGEFKACEGIVGNGPIQSRDADVQMSCHASPYLCAGVVAMTEHSREGRGAHAPSAGRNVRRACTEDAAPILAFLRNEDIWPVPQESDLVSLLGRNDAAMFCAWSGEHLTGVAGGIVDGPSMRLLHLAVDPRRKAECAELAAALERHAASWGVAAIFAQVADGSAAYRELSRRGYAEDFREVDVVAGRALTIVDLIKLIGDGGRQ